MARNKIDLMPPNYQRKTSGNFTTHLHKKRLLRNTPEIQAIKAKIDKWKYFKLRRFCTIKKTTQ